MLEIEHLSVAYGHVSAVRDVSLHVEEGETVGLIGPNGAGKTSVLNAIVGLAPVVGGEIRFLGEPLSNRSTEYIVKSGISMVAEGRQVFTRLTVEENLLLAAGTAGHKGREALDGVTERFPILARYRALPAGQLSGGEQQMLVIGRALLSRPRILMLDEPSLGLAPRIVGEVFDIISDLKDEGVTVLLVEQNAARTIAMVDRTYVMTNGTIHTLTAGDRMDSTEELITAYLGSARKKTA